MDFLAKSPSSNHLTRRVSVYEGNILALLTSEHVQIEKLFQKFELALEQKNYEEKLAVVNRICAELIASMEAEEEIFYPAVRKALNDHNYFYESQAEHSTIQDLLWKIISLNHLNPLYDARVRVLENYVKRHVQSEEVFLFPRIRRSNLNLLKLGVEFTQLRLKIINTFSGIEGVTEFETLKRHILKVVTINWL